VFDVVSLFPLALAVAYVLVSIKCISLQQVAPRGLWGSGSGLGFRAEGVGLRKERIFTKWISLQQFQPETRNPRLRP